MSSYARYLDVFGSFLLFDCRLSWKKYIFSKRKQLGVQLGKMYWLLDSKSQVLAENKLAEKLYNYNYAKQFSNLFGLMESNYGHGVQFKYRNIIYIIQILNIIPK